MKLLLVWVLILNCLGAVAAPKDPLINFFKGKTKIDKPFELRDPFKAPPLKSDKKDMADGYYKTGTNFYTNIPQPSVQSIDQIKLVGVLVGKERRAMISLGGNNIITLKEGQKIGEEGAELKAILPGGIIVVEKMMNVYGQEEYLETVIPISK